MGNVFEIASILAWYCFRLPHIVNIANIVNIVNIVKSVNIVNIGNIVNIVNTVFYIQFFVLRARNFFRSKSFLRSQSIAKVWILEQFHRLHLAHLLYTSFGISLCQFWDQWQCLNFWIHLFLREVWDSGKLSKLRKWKRGHNWSRVQRFSYRLWTWALYWALYQWDRSSMGANNVCHH